MFTKTPSCLARLFALILFVATCSVLYGQQASKTGELRFTADNQSERDSGVWIDGKYAGYVKELKGDRKVLLVPGTHEVLIRQAGFKDLSKSVIIESDQVQTIAVVLEENTQLTYPGANAAELRLDIVPKRAAVYVDGGYMGHGGDFSGRFHSMLLTPGKHRLKITLDGYRSYETDVEAVASNKSQMKIALEKDADAPAQQ
jgi:hypothetical protein